MILFISKYHSYQEYIHIETESRCIKDMLDIDKSVDIFLVPSGHRRNRDRDRDDRDWIKLQPSTSTATSYPAYRIQEKLLVVTYNYQFLTLAAFSDLLRLSLMLSFRLPEYSCSFLSMPASLFPTCTCPPAFLTRH